MMIIPFLGHLLGNVVDCASVSSFVAVEGFFRSWCESECACQFYDCVTSLFSFRNHRDGGRALLWGMRR